MFSKALKVQRPISNVLLVIFLIFLFNSKYSYKGILSLPLFVYPYALIIFQIVFFKYGEIHLDKRLKVIWFLYVAFIIPIFISLLFVPSGTSQRSYLNGLISFIAIYIPIIIMLSAINSAGTKQKSKYIKIYVYVIIFLAFYSILETLLFQFTTINLNIEMSRFFHFTGSMDEYNYDKFGLGGIVFYRSSGITGDPSIAGLIYLIGLIICIRHFKKKGILSLILIISIILTYSTSIMFLTMIYLSTLIFKSARGRGVFIIIFIGTILIVGFVSQREMITALINYRFSLSGSAENHLQINIKTLKILYDHPMGVGYKTFGDLYPNIYSAHNSYLQVIVETGVIGLFFFLMWLRYIFITIYKQKSEYSKTFIYILVIICLSSFAHDMIFRFEFMFSILFLASIILGDNHRTKISL